MFNSAENVPIVFKTSILKHWLILIYFVYKYQIS